MKQARLWTVGLLVAVLAMGAARASTVVGLSVEDQARLSSLVVVGTVVSQVGETHPEHGIETAVTIAVTEVLKGNARPGDPVVFYLRGGQVGQEVSRAIGEAELKIGQQALVFIESVEGRLYNLGLSMGVWDLHRDAAGRTMFTRAIRDGLEVVGDVEVERGPLSLVEIGRRVDTAARRPGIENQLLRTTTLGGR